MVRTQERFRCRGNVRFIVEQVRRPSPSEIDDGELSRTTTTPVLKSMTMKATSKNALLPSASIWPQPAKAFASLAERLHQQFGFVSPSAVVSFNQPGSLNYQLATWMMRDDVKKALHVEDSPNKQWPGPGPKWQYIQQWDACNPNPQFNQSMVDFYKNIAPRLEARGGRTIVFNGDTDPCVSYEGTRAALATVFPEIPGGAYRPWFYNQAKATTEFLASKPLLFGPNLALVDAGAQLGGMVVNYEHNLRFVTVHGSGHMVPQFRPQSALRLLYPFVWRKICRADTNRRSACCFYWWWI